MKRSYILPQTEAQSMTMCQLMAGSTKSMGVGGTVEGNEHDGIIFGG